MSLRLFVSVIAALPFLLAVPGCDRGSSAGEVVLYTSVDEPVARGIVAEFERTSGIKVIMQTDTEATKSVGLVERIRAEKDSPQSDVLWANEIFNTINLGDEGLLAPYESPSAADIPKHFKDPESRWAGTGLRARVIATRDPNVKGLEDLTDPRLKGKIAIARPSAGTTGGHVAALYSLWGDDAAARYFQKLRDNGVALLGGNSVVAEQVARGTMIAGLTDNDDVAEARENLGGEGASKIEMVLPDQNAAGTLAIPTTVALIAGAKHPDAARKLIDYLLSQQVERRLIEKKFAGWSVRVGTDGVKWMPVDYHAVARQMPAAIRSATAILEGRSE